MDFINQLPPSLREATEQHGEKMADSHQILAVDLENLMPFNENMSRGECYGKGMYDLAVTVKRMIDSAKASKESQSYIYWGAILEGLIDNLEHLTHGILIFRKYENKEE